MIEKRLQQSGLQYAQAGRKNNFYLTKKNFSINLVNNLTKFFGDDMCVAINFHGPIYVSFIE